MAFPNFADITTAGLKYRQITDEAKASIARVEEACLDATRCLASILSVPAGDPDGRTVGECCEEWQATCDRVAAAIGAELPSPSTDATKAAGALLDARMCGMRAIGATGVGVRGGWDLDALAAIRRLQIAATADIATRPSSLAV